MSGSDSATLTAAEAICARLTERRATLFLGAGINYGLVNDDGISCPLGQPLADMIWRDLLEAEPSNRPLDEAAEMARYRLGSRAVNGYLHKLFSSFRPGAAHLSLVGLPWSVIYTTNYDTLIEEAARAKKEASEVAGTIRSLFSIAQSLESFSEEDILYYKLHGCIDFANTEEGRLILTKEDYRFYETFRRPLFKRLRENLQNHSFVFIGYSLTDSNFRGILEDCRNELGTKTFPLSFAIRFGSLPTERTFWQDKYNISTIDCDATDFIQLLKDTWNAGEMTVVPFDERRTRSYLRVDETSRFRRVGESFLFVKPDECVGASNPKVFFKGASPSWADIRDHVAPPRDAYQTLLNAMLDELVDPAVNGNTYLVTGPAGTGKTTLLRSLAYDCAHGLATQVLLHIPGTPLDHRAITSLVSDDEPRRIVVLIEHGAEIVPHLDRFVQDARKAKLRLTVLIEERRNQWLAAIGRQSLRTSVADFDLGTLSEGEIERILDALARYDALGKLTGVQRDYQVQHFTSLASLELLVALRELTSEHTFDVIVRDEFAKLPTALAKAAYLYVSALGQLDLPVRFEVLARVLHLPAERLGQDVLAPTDGVLVSMEDFGWSRHNAGFRLKARHPIIASVIFAEAAPDDDAKFDVINSLLSELDPGMPEDRRLLDGIVVRKELANTLVSHQKRRALYERLETLLPGEPFVLQHRSIIERDMGDAEAAMRYAQKAIEQQPKNAGFKNTLGMAIAAKARHATGVEKLALHSKATQIFDEGIRANSHDSYGYLGKLQLAKQVIFETTDPEQQVLLRDVTVIVT